MGAEFTDLTWDEMCDLMCGAPEEDMEDDNEKINEGRFLQNDGFKK